MRNYLYQSGKAVYATEYNVRKYARLTGREGDDKEVQEKEEVRREGYAQNSRRGGSGVHL